MTSTRDGAGVRWPVLGWAAALLAVAGLSVATAWSGVPALVVLVVAAVLPMLLLTLVTLLGVSRWAATAVLALLLVLTAYLMSAGADTSLVGTVSDALPRLLSEPRPYATTAALLAPPVLLVGLVSLLVGLRLGARTRVAPVAGAVVVYVAGALLSAGHGDPVGILAVLVLVLALLGWVLLDEHHERASQRLLVAGPVVVVLVGALASVALVPVDRGFEPRTLVSAPLTSVDQVSPLPQLGAWLANPQAELFSTRGPAVPMRLVTLDGYDGSQWNAATSYAPIGTTSSSELAPGVRRQTSTEQVTLDGLGGSWLPSPGDPLAVSDHNALADPRTGTLFDPDSAGDVVYTVTGVADAPDPARLVGATVPTTGAATAYLRQPELPFALARYAQAVTRGTTTAYSRALAIEAAVKHDRRVSSRTISGSAFWRIQEFLFGRPGAAGSRVGTSEQFATAFAVLARQSGLPTRLVVGFRPGDLQPDGTRVVRGKDALAWPEVYFDQLGWVPFAPTPQQDSFLPDRPELGTTPPGRPAVPSAAPTPAPGPAPGHASAGPGPDGGGSGGRLDRWPWALGLAVLVVALGLLLARALRRSRHLRRGATGAWSEVADYLSLAGFPRPVGAGALQLAALADNRWGIDAATRVAMGAERAAFGPPHQGQSGQQGGQQGDRPTVRGDLAVVRRAARRSLPWWRRWSWGLDPRVLRR